MIENDPKSVTHIIISEDQAREIRRVTWIGLLVNLLLSAFKFAAGILGSSHAVVADAIHSLSDSTTDIAILIGSRYWSRPPDETHPYGHRRIETLVTIFIGIVLLAVAVEISWVAIRTIHEKNINSPGWIALVAAGVSILCKETLYRWTASTGKRIRSSSLVANAWHHRTDAISSIPVFLAVGGAILVSSWEFLDHIGAIVVSLLIMQAGLRIIWPGIREFIDVGAPRQVCEQIKTIAMEVEGVKQVHAIRTRYIGTCLQADLHIVVDGSLTVLEGHDIAGIVKSQILTKGPDVIDVLVHTEPPEAALPEEDCLQ